MSEMKKIFVINLGSTSSKIAYCENDKIVKQVELQHDTKELRALGGSAEKITEFFGKHVDKFIEESGIRMEEMDAIAVRGIGKGGSYHHGAYLLTPEVVKDGTSGPVGHVGLLSSTARGGSLSQKFNIPAYLYDVVPTDEVDDITRITGVAGYNRHIASHTLNMRAAARKAAEQMGKKLEDVNLIIAHMGGGFGSVAIHNGTIVDTNSAEEGSFTPERPGRINSSLVSALYTDPSYTKEDINRILKKDVGLYGYLGTSNCIEVEQRIADGDEKAKRVYEAMAYQVSKDICGMCAILCGKVDAVVLTGGIAHSKLFTGWIEERVKFIAPVIRMAGAFEIEALAGGVTRVLNGEEAVNDYNAVKDYVMFNKE